jgi:5-methylcytosine-specific restriction endonuclease McrA
MPGVRLLGEMPMKNNYSHHICSHESRLLCEALSTGLGENIPNLKRSESQQWCGLYQDGRNRFAYISHQKSGSAITIWCLGEPEGLIEVTKDSHLQIRPRAISKGGWDKTFKCRFTLEDISEIDAAINALTAVSYRKTFERDSGSNRKSIHHLQPLAEEITEIKEYPEGTATKVLINSYERNPKARAKCIEFHGARCCICGFDFEAAYGRIGTGYIHVHHLTPLSSITKEYRVDPKKDLRPVCPNCHAIIHRKNPPFTIEEVRNLLKAH